MKKQIMIFVVGIAVFIVGYAAQSWTLAQCQKTNQHTKECYDPDNRISSCTTLSYEDCSISIETMSAIYEIENFPDGATTADSGVTMEKGADCWQRVRCYWKGDKSTGSCQQGDSWTPWYQKSRTENNPDDTCPKR